MFLESFDDELCKLAISLKMINRAAKSVAAPKDVVKKRWFGGTKVVKGTTPGISEERVGRTVSRSQGRSERLKRRFGETESELARMDRGKAGRTGRTREQLTADRERLQRQFGKERELRRSVPVEREYAKRRVADDVPDSWSHEERMFNRMEARRGSLPKPSNRQRRHSRRQEKILDRYE